MATKRKMRASDYKMSVWVVLTKMEVVAKTMVSLVEVWESALDSVVAQM